MGTIYVIYIHMSIGVYHIKWWQHVKSCLQIYVCLLLFFVFLFFADNRKQGNKLHSIAISLSVSHYFHLFLCPIELLGNVRKISATLTQLRLCERHENSLAAKIKIKSKFQLLYMLHISIYMYIPYIHIYIYDNFTIVLPAL